MSPRSGGLAVSVPGLAFSVDRHPEIETYVMGTYDPVNMEAARGWGPRVEAFKVKGPQFGQYAPGMRAQITMLNPDLVDVQGLWTYPAFASLRHARSTGRPYMVTPRGMLDPWALQNSAWKKRLASVMFQSAHLRGAACLRATAEMEAQHFRAVGLRNPIAIVPNGIDIPQLAPRSRDSRRTVLFLSRIHPKKGIRYLLTAWGALQHEFSDWKLVIAGIDENGYEAELKSIAAVLGLCRVYFLGPVHGDVKQRLYRDADLFVLPTHAENFGLVVAEALAQETPVITTTNAPWSGLVSNKCGWWIDLDQDRMIETLRLAFSQPSSSLDAMGQRGREWVIKDFGMDSVAQQMRDVYLWAAGRASRPENVFE
jgi:glycosyltransferase involved in cell wall biosynthesis